MDRVKLPPINVKRAKDAARSVKQEMKQAITYVYEKALTDMLDLPYFAVDGYAIETEIEQEMLHVYCHLTIEAAVCPLCKCIAIDVKEHKERCVRDVECWGKRTFVHFAIRRFECAECGHRFTEELSAVAWRRHQTIRFEEEVYQRCLQSSKSAVAKALQLHYSTVDTIFKRYAKRQAKRGAHSHVRILGIDEIALKKRHKQFALILSDLQRRCVIAVLPSREQAAIKVWFDTLSPEQQQAIRVVSMDMWRPYRSFVEQFLPDARIVADRFHVMKQLNEQLSNARRQIQRTADAEAKAALKGCRWLLVRNRTDLSEAQQARLHLALQADAELRTAYALKEEFRLIFEKVHDREKARRFLCAWMLKVRYTANSYLLDFLNTLLNWFEQILNYFDQRITNGFVEGTNRAIRFLISRAFGFRNFDNFRLVVLAQHGPPV